MTSFYLARPWFLLLLIVPIAFVIVRIRRKSVGQRMLNREIYRYLNRENTSTMKKNFRSFALPWILATFAMTGPTIVDSSAPVYQTEENWVWVLDMSNSMLADDVKPSRYMQMRYSLLQMLNQAGSNKRIAVVVYAGNAYTLVPPTNDINTLRSYIKRLEPSQMPMQGTNLPRAIELAENIAERNQNKTNILIVTDTVENESEADLLAEYINASPNSYYLYLIGTPNGAALKKQDQSLIKDQSGNVVIAKSNFANADRLVSNSSIKAYHAGNEYELAHIFELSDMKKAANERNIYSEQDLGYWFALPLLLLVYSFRKGFIISFALAIFASIAAGFVPTDAFADDVEGIMYFKQGEFKKAAESFDDVRWIGNSYYRLGEYRLAIEYYERSSELESPLVTYNLANCYAQSGDIQNAIMLYERVLETDNEMTFDAKFNLEQLKKFQAEESIKERDIQRSGMSGLTATESSEDNTCSKNLGCHSINPDDLIRSRLINMQRKSNFKIGPSQQW